MGREVKVGDYVRITIDGPWRSWDDDFPADVQYGVQPAEAKPAEWLANPGDVVTIKKIEPPVEAFGPGSVVRCKDDLRLVYTLGSGGYYAHDADQWRAAGSDEHRLAGPFTSEEYERVEVG